MRLFRHLSSAALFAVSAAALGAPELIEGEIRKVDKEAAKLTIRHGEIKRLAMAPMTMVFRVQDPAMLDKVKAGDKVQFAADKVEGMLTVTVLEAAR